MTMKEVSFSDAKKVVMQKVQDKKAKKEKQIETAEKSVWAHKTSIVCQPPSEKYRENYDSIDWDT